MSLRKIPFSNGDSTDTLSSSNNIQYDTTANALVSTVAYTPSTPSNWPVVPTTVNGALDELAGTQSIIYLPTFFERISTGSGSGNYTVGGYSASGTNNGYFVLNNYGNILGAGVNVQSSGFTSGDALIIVAGNVNTAQTTSWTLPLILAPQWQYTFNFIPSLSFRPGDQLILSWQFNLAGTVAYMSTSVMFKTSITS